MISVEEARKIIAAEVRDFGVTNQALPKSLSRVLREDILTDRRLPPYDRVTMDGIAISYGRSVAKAVLRLPIKGVAPAGSPQLQLTDPASCVEVMTGAILPTGTDTVIRYEDLKIDENFATILANNINQGQNIHYAGEDRIAGELVAKKGTLIRQAEIGVAASCGYHHLAVSQLPSCVIVSTGDELVNVEDTPAPHQIRRSNVHMINASLSRYHIDAHLSHINDDLDTLGDVLSQHLEIYDFIILSGGVSMGKFDYLPQVFEELGVKKLFHRIKQRPGKPFWFGKTAAGKIVFALPGNPVSSFMCTHRYIIPWLEGSLQLQHADEEYAVLSVDLPFKPDLTFYPIVSLHQSSDGIQLARPVNNNGSGDFVSLTAGDAFLELPRGTDMYKAHKAYRVIRYRYKS